MRDSARKYIISQQSLIQIGVTANYTPATNEQEPNGPNTRHGALLALGHPVVVLRAVTEENAADQAERLVREWMAGNDDCQIAAAC